MTAAGAQSEAIRLGESPDDDAVLLGEVLDDLIPALAAWLGFGNESA